MGETKKQVIWALKNYKALKKKACECINDLASVGLTANYSSIGSPGGRDNKVEERALKIENERLNAWRWCLVVEKTYDHHRPDGKARLIDLQFFQNKPKWQVARALHVSEKTRYNWEENIIITAEFWAGELGLTK